MPITAIAMRNAPADRAGSVSGLLQTTQQLGAATGLAVVVTVYAAQAVPGQFLPGARAAFLTAAAMSVLAAVAGLTLCRPRLVPSPLSCAFALDLAARNRHDRKW